MDKLNYELMQMKKAQAGGMPKRVHEGRSKTSRKKIIQRIFSEIKTA